MHGKGQALLGRDGVRMLARVLKFGNCDFPSLFECPRVLLLAINTHQISWIQLVSVTATAELDAIPYVTAPISMSGKSP
jgi:hypothetical protein